MHNNTTDKLKELAKAILALEQTPDIDLLKEKTLAIYNELCVLDYLKKQSNIVEEPKEENEDAVDTQPEIIESVMKEPVLFSIKEEIGTSESLEDIFIKKDSEDKTKIPQEDTSSNSGGTLKDKIEAAKKASEKSLEEAIKHHSVQNNRASLNDTLLKSGISVDLNDRIAFVKHLFEGSQEDFNRVLSQLNTFENEEDSKNFILNQVKLDYSWEGKEDYEERLLLLIERKFM
jgi:hypothetical protein